MRILATRLILSVVSASAALLLTGCGTSVATPPGISAIPGKLIGRTMGGQNPITGGTIQLWQVNSTTDGGIGSPMLSATVTSSDGTGMANSNANIGNAMNTLPAGYFTITNDYTCPVGDALVYITASGGNPGLAAGTNNPQAKMVTALGSCNSLKSNVPFVNISELTTVATVAALHNFMSGYNAIGAAPGHAIDLAAQFAVVNEYVNSQTGVAPGPALPSGYDADTGDVNHLANVLSACVNSAGGAAPNGTSDGTACGNLFQDAPSPSGVYPADITTAALYVRTSPQNDVVQIFSLATPQVPFLPSSSTAPLQWNLPISEIPTPPTFSLAPGTYSGTQQVSILDADQTATIYYQINGTPTTSSPVYQSPITVRGTETVNAIAYVNRSLTSGVASAAYVINGTTPGVLPVTVAGVEALYGSTTPALVYAYNGAAGSVVTFGTTGGADGSFSPSSCTLSSGGYCSVNYIPSGVLAPGNYNNELTASFTAAGTYSAAIAYNSMFIDAASTSTFTTIHPTGSGNNFIQASDGYFYGAYGAFSGGNIYKFDSSGNVTTLYTFPSSSNPVNPVGSLVQGTDGNFYGVTSPYGQSGNGYIFKITSSGNLTQLYTFTGSLDGAYPTGGLIQGTDGNFYGLTAGGGTLGGGTAFKMDSSGNVTPLHSFVPSTEGFYPAGLLVQGADGAFYGTTELGGTNNLGAVFKMDASGNVTTLYSFTGLADGAGPEAGLVQGTDGNFYGTTVFGGTFGAGSIFKISASGNFTPLYSLNGGGNGSRPFGSLVQGTDGRFYGTTSLAGTTSNGTLFSVDSSGNFITQHTFGNTGDGGQPYAGLVQGSDGSLYGTSTRGSIYRLTASPALTGPVTLTTPPGVTHGTSFNLSYAVANSGSKTMQQCFATNNAGDTTGWVGVKTAAIATTNATLTAPATPGSYTYSLTCGGTESGFATLLVN